jgi:hypothetical protein
MLTYVELGMCLSSSNKYIQAGEVEVLALVLVAVGASGSCTWRTLRSSRKVRAGWGKARKKKPGQGYAGKQLCLNRKSRNHDHEYNSRFSHLGSLSFRGGL